MIDISRANLELISLNKVGNKAKGENNIISPDLFYPNDEEKNELLVHFLVPFKNLAEVNRFCHSSDIEYNEVYSFCCKIFKKNKEFLKYSSSIIKHLYEQSDHPNIKSGEVSLVYFHDIIFEGQLSSAIGIYKSERKESFFQFKKSGGGLVLATQKGIASKKLDKACLIINIEEEDGLRVLSLDNNNYDTEYWKYKFLQIEEIQDFNFQTRSYISLCKNFSNDVVERQEGKKESISFLNQSMKYLSNNESLEEEEFIQTVFDNKEIRQQFINYKKQYEENYDVILHDEFEISKSVLHTQKRKVKNQINLDTQIQIKLGFNEEIASDQYIERGFDESKKMFFYKIFFNKELE
ncbi:MAG: nucleoid-associated protein [Bacteroidetes bacterium]|nr:nucleoid-associated protein [Bacteroidota bacterium]